MYKKDDKTYYDWIDYAHDIKEVKDLEFDHVVGIYRGGLPMAVHISNVFEVPMSIVGFQTRDGEDEEPYMIHKSEDVPTQLLVVDDIYDSGRTMNKVIKFLSHYSARMHNSRIQGFCLFGKDNDLNVSCANIHDGSWIVFPWETLNEPV
jgi:hypoxanthine phosphoribosyltransferase